jgi:hypothetical protein
LISFLFYLTSSPLSQLFLSNRCPYFIALLYLLLPLYEQLWIYLYHH